jgi:hypothetical protein
MREFVLIIPGTVGSVKDKMAEWVGVAVIFQALFGWYSVRISIGSLAILTKVFFRIFLTPSRIMSRFRSDYRRGLVNRFIDHLQVVSTNKYNTVADFHTTNHSTLSLLSMLSLVVAW